MRVLFTTWAWPSHYFPMVPLAWALRAAGHEVRVASQPALADVVARSGQLFVPVGRDVDMVAFHRDRLGPVRVERRAPDPPDTWDDAKRRRVRRSFDQFAVVADAMADDLLALAERWRPDLVVHDPITYAGALVAEVVGVPAVRSLFGPDFNYAIRDLEIEAAAPLAERFGLERIDPVGALTVDPVPELLQFPAPIQRQFVRYVPYSGLSTVPELPPGRRVCVSWGTTTAKFSPEHAERLPDVLRALNGLAEIVLAVTPDQLGLLPPVPEGVVVVESAPLDVLLPQCDAVVHQGGAGTTLTAALHGLPQLLVVHTPDQVVNAIPLEESGAGDYLVPGETNVRERVEWLLDGPPKEAAGKLRADMVGRPSYAEAVRALERLADRGSER